MSTLFSDELDVLLSIYGDNVKVSNDANGETIVQYFENDYIFKISIPAAYPSVSPLFVASSTGTKRLLVLKKSIISKIENLLAENIGSEVLFQLIELYREEINDQHQYEANKNVTNEYLDNENEVEDIYVDSETNLNCFRNNGELLQIQPQNTEYIMPWDRIIHGQIIMERKSTFQGHMAIVHSMEEVWGFRTALLQDKKPLTSVSFHDYDDDGETAAGGRLAELLRLMPADGVAVIVTRYFGGVKLGPDRFKFINNAARQMLEEQGFGRSSHGPRSEDVSDDIPVGQNFKLYTLNLGDILNNRVFGRTSCSVSIELSVPAFYRYFKTYLTPIVQLITSADLNQSLIWQKFIELIFKNQNSNNPHFVASNASLC
eukprot:gene4710-9332_t